MTPQSSTRWVGPVSLFAATLIIASQGLHLALGLTMGAQPSDNLLHSVKYAFALIATIALVFALTGLYLRQADAAGRLGLVGYVVAFIGTVLMAGDWWFESFIAPQIAAVAPQVMTGAIPVRWWSVRSQPSSSLLSAGPSSESQPSARTSIRGRRPP